MNAPADNTSVAAVAATEGVDLRLSTEEFHADLERAGAHVKSKWGMAWFLAKRYPLGAVGLAVVVIFVLVAAFAPYITRHDPLATNPRISLGVPTAAHPMGTDFMGRDLYSRVVYGARTSLAVAFGATALGVFLGVLIGLACGFLGGTVDLTIQRFIDMLQSLPTLILAMAMAAALGPSLTNTIIAIAIPKLPSIARVIRANTLSLREMPFVEAVRAMGMSEMRIAIRHILPNTLGKRFVEAQLGFDFRFLLRVDVSRVLEQDVRDVPGNDAHQRENDDRDAEHRDDEQHRPPDKVRAHVLSPPSTVSVGYRSPCASKLGSAAASCRAVVRCRLLRHCFT